MTIKVWFKVSGESDSRVLSNLKPRRYMTSWGFKKLLRYVENECCWKDINVNDVDTITLSNEKEHWTTNITRD